MNSPLTSLLIPKDTLRGRSRLEQQGTGAIVWGWRRQGAKGSKPVKEGLVRSRQGCLVCYQESFGVQTTTEMLHRKPS